MSDQQDDYFTAKLTWDEYLFPNEESVTQDGDDRATGLPWSSPHSNPVSDVLRYIDTIKAKEIWEQMPHLD